MKNLNKYIIEKLHLNNDTRVSNKDLTPKDLKKYKDQLKSLLDEDQFKDLDVNNKEIYSIWKNTKNKEAYLYRTSSYEELEQLWILSKTNPDKYGRYCTFQPSKNSAFSVINGPLLKHINVIDKTDTDIKDI